MKRRIVKLSVAVGALAVVLALISGFAANTAPSSPRETKIAELRSQLAATEASLPGLEAELKRDIDSRWDNRGRDEAQTERWKAIVTKSKGRLDEAKRLVIELKLTIRELEAGIEPPEPEPKRGAL